jgi:manganese transport protein
VLSLQLPFAIVPLIRFTSERSILGRFATPAWAQWLAWLIAGCIVGLNAWLIARALSQWQGPGGMLASLSPLFLAIALGCGALLLWISLAPLRGVKPSSDSQ